MNSLKETPLEVLSDVATEAHRLIQKDFSDINPIVGVSRKMRSVGIPVDTMTIDCLKSDKRIILILHDERPNSVQYQFAYRNKDPEEKFELIALEELTVKQLYLWIKDYFS